MSLDCNKELRQNAPTRWNSTYLMLESVIHYRHAFVYLEMIDISSFLGYFYSATCAFYDTKYPITNLYFFVVALIYVILKQELVSADGYRRLMANQMISKFEKYLSL
jgi:hypothetical protein